MQETTIKIMKTTNVENPMSFDEWCKKYKFGSRIVKKQLDIDMYKRGEYDFNKLSKIIKSKKLSFYERIFFLFKTA
jgi:hypothetical protein